MSKMRSGRTTLAWLGLSAGLSAIVFLVAWNGIDTVGRAIASGGWALLLLSCYVFFDLAGSTISWRLLFARGRAPRLSYALEAEWMGSAVNSLLPVAGVGGEVVRARQVMRHGTPGLEAAASVIVDKTVQALTVLIWGLIGLALLIGHTGDRQVIAGGAVGFALFAAGVAGFFLVQRLGVFGPAARAAAQITKRTFWHGLAGSAADLDHEIRATYRRLERFLWAATAKLSTRIVLATEVSVAALLMDQHIPLLDAFMIRSLAVTVRAMAFAIPGGLGAQEGAFVAVGALIGYPADLMLAISLATRVREIVPYLPGLLAWQLAEGRALRRRTAAQSRSVVPSQPR
ncbi:MAG TPA: lysylphosphatidylglycerol synthase domain-containing protein [Alphaproteobacteria bacterium]|jgi:putative membrane protein